MKAVICMISVPCVLVTCVCLCCVAACGDGGSVEQSVIAGAGTSRTNPPIAGSMEQAGVMPHSSLPCRAGAGLMMHVRACKEPVIG